MRIWQNNIKEKRKNYSMINKCFKLLDVEKWYVKKKNESRLFTATINFMVFSVQNELQCVLHLDEYDYL